MTVINQHRVGKAGYVEEHLGVIKGTFTYTCHCKRPLTISIRRKKTRSSMFELEVKHGSRERTFSTKDLTELHVFDRIISVQKFARCGLPVKEGI